MCGNDIGKGLVALGLAAAHGRQRDDKTPTSEAELRSGPCKKKKLIFGTDISRLLDAFGNGTQLFSDLFMALSILGHQFPLYSNRS